MVLQKRLDYGINGYQVPPIPHVPKSAKGKRSVRKKIVDKQMCAFDLLAAVAGKLLFEGEIFSSPSKISRAPNPNKGKDVIKKEKLNDEKPVGHDVCDLGSCNKSKLLREGQRHKEVFTEKESPCIDKVDNNNTKNGTIVDGNKMVVDAKPHGLVPFCGDRNIHSSISPKCWDEKLVVDRDDDEKFSGCTHPSIRAHKALKHQGIGQRRIRKQVATKFWKVASTMTKDREPSYTGGEVKPSFHNRKLCYTRQRTQRSAFKRRTLFQRCSILASNGRINGEENMLPSSSINGHLTSYDPEDFHVKLRIKSFKVPELFIELPETSTVGSLKRTVMEAVTAILGGGLHVGVLLRGKKVKDDDKTLIQAGISHSDMLDDVGFTLEPKSNHSPALLTSPEESQLLLPCVPAEPVARRPVMPTSDGKSDVCPEPPLTPQLNCLESDLDSVHSPADTLSLDKTAENVRPLIAIPSLSVDALPMIPTRKPKRSDMVQRRIRRPFSVSEVEALVQAVEKLGTGRWRDVKIRAFDNAKHRTYVDLKDKWKTLVHTARISPQQRRGEPVPQDLLDRVLSAHAYWSHQQAKSPTTETCLLI